MLGELDDLRVLQALHHGKHLVGAPQLLAKEDELVLDEELRLPGDRGYLGIDRIAVGAVTGRAELQLLLRQSERRKKGGEQESPPPRAERRMHYCFFAASFFA